MKNIIFLTILLALCLCFSACNKEKEPQSLEEYVLERVQKECGQYNEFILKDVIRVKKFENTQFEIIYGGQAGGSTELYFVYHEGKPDYFWGSTKANNCSLNFSDYNFKLGEKYAIWGYGIYADRGTDEGGTSLLIDRIEKIE